MKNIAIFGAGGFGKEVACLINKLNEKEPVWNLIGFFDDGVESGTQISHFGKVLGGVDAVNAYNKPLAIVMAIGSSKTVRKIVKKISNSFIEYPNLIHPSFDVTDPETFKIGKGNIIQRNCTATCDNELGDFNVLNGSVAIGHDTKIGSFNTFMPNTRISGEVVLGNYNFFGVGSIVLQQIKVGDDIRLGAGSVLMRKPKPGFLYMGNPAKKVEF